MTNRTFARKIGIVASIAVLALIGAITGLASNGGATNLQSLPYGAAYQPLSSSLESTAGVQLNQLDASQFASVVVAPNDALSAAEKFGDISVQADVTENVSLGSFSDSTFSEKLPSGSYGFVATGVPAYVVTFSGLSLPTLSESGVVANEAIVVNATTGTVIEGIKFN